ncbi:MAG TPA: hypothetical protein VJB13_05125 [Candidatus Nanoarchaeia archaeon]|nr:hypothetical protein [Candidatus Nanoarchaeia archaeon]
MKLTIDTQVDTHEDIRKVLQILTSILEKKDSSLSSVSSSTSSPSADTTDLMSMFSEQKGTVETKGSAPDFSSFLNLTSQKKESNDDEEGKIEFY